METITNTRHPRKGILLSTTYLFQSASHFSIQSVLVFYMIDSFLGFSTGQSFEFYALLAVIPLLSRVLGGILGDLLFGNRNAMIIGGIIQVIGAFVLFVPNEVFFYTGIIFVSIGGGLYRPNLKAQHGKAYLDRTKLMDGGFSLLYLSYNLGAVVGMIFGALIGKMYGYRFAFLFSGGMMIISLIPFFFIKATQVIEKAKRPSAKRNGVLKIIVILLFLGFFISLFQIGDYPAFDLRQVLKSKEAFGIPGTYWNSLSNIAVVIAVTVITIFWTIFHIARRTKLLVSAIVGLLSFGILLLIPDHTRDFQEHHAFIYFAFILLAGFAEAILAPIVNSWIIEYGNSKYYAILLSLTDIPITVISYLLSYYAYSIINYSFNSPTYLGLSGMFILVIGTSIYLLVTKSSEKPTVSSKDLLDN